MQDEPKERQAPVSQKWFRRIYWMPITIFIVGLFLFAMLMWTKKINERIRMGFEVCDALMDIQIETGATHLLLEEAISGDIPMDIEKISGGIDLAIRLAEALLKGGKSEHGQLLQPLKDSKLRKRVEDIYSLLTQYKTIALQRIHDSNAANDSDLYERFHGVFKAIQKRTKALEIVLEKDQIRTQARAKRLLSGILLTCIFIVAGATVGLWNREVRRKAAERGLQKANEQLQSQTEELMNFREHLMELVKKRTMELITTDTHLLREIIEREQAEKSLGESENKCRILVDYLPQKIYLKDQNSVYTYCNDNFARDLNIKADEIVGKTDYDLFSQEIAEKNIAEDNQIIKFGNPIDIEEKHVKDGEEVIIHKFMMPTPNGSSGVNGILGILWDVTERVRLEAVAEAVTTMNNIGSIFAGIRHEIGNPINSAKMTLSVLKSKINTYSREVIEEYLERALGEISGVEYLLKTLKSFNMYETLGPQNVELKPFMDKFLSFLADDLGKKGITIESSFQPEAQWGYADPRALQQVMLNIMSNASDAMEGRDSPRIIVEVSKVDYIIRIKVTDNGCGISEEQQKRLFTPFFTSKPSGTGLGLVIAKKLLSKMNGTIEITSQRDEGTTVEILIQEGRDEH